MNRPWSTALLWAVAVLQRVDFWTGKFCVCLSVKISVCACADTVMMKLCTMYNIVLLLHGKIRGFLRGLAGAVFVVTAGKFKRVEDPLRGHGCPKATS